MKQKFPQSAIDADPAIANGLQALVRLLARRSARNWQAGLHASEPGEGIILIRKDGCSDEQGKTT